jgi:hypothetical protein
MDTCPVNDSPPVRSTAWPLGASPGRAIRRRAEDVGSGAVERQRLQFRHPRLTEVHESAQSSSGRLTVQLPRIGQPGETLRASR